MDPISTDTLLASLRWRYATKAFDPTAKISDTEWAALEDSLILTPSSFGLQPWHFIVVTDPAMKAELLPHSWNQTQVIECSHFVILAARTDIGETDVQQWIERISEVRNEEATSLDGYRQMMTGFMSQMDAEKNLHWSKSQSYIALGQLMTSAALLGIDACPMEGFVPAEYDRILGLTEKGLTASVACALGYRSADDKYANAAKVRYDKSALISRI